jgi:hypothetical protein
MVISPFREAAQPQFAEAMNNNVASAVPYKCDVVSTQLHLNHSEKH